MCFLIHTEKACHLPKSHFYVRLKLCFSEERSIAQPQQTLRKSHRAQSTCYNQSLVQFTSFLASLISLEPVTGATQYSDAVCPEWWAFSLWEQRAYCLDCVVIIVIAAHYRRVKVFPQGTHAHPQREVSTSQWEVCSSDLPVLKGRQLRPPLSLSSGL